MRVPSFATVIVVLGLAGSGGALAQAPDERIRSPPRASDESAIIEVLTIMLREAQHRESLALLRAIRVERLLVERSQPAPPLPQRPESQK